MTGYEAVCEALDLNPNTSRHNTLCPAHDDNRESLSVSEGRDGRTLIFCFAGCSVESILKEVELEWADLFGTEDRVPVAEYVYERAPGKPYIIVTRYSPKGFSQVGADGTSVKELEFRPPYRLPEILSRTGETIYVCEGEKDADGMKRAYGVLSTTFLGGAGKWRAEYLQYFEGRDVVIVAHKDDAGRAGAEIIAAQIRRVANDVRIVVAAHGNDAADHINAGFNLEDLEEEGGGLDEFGPLDWETYETEATDWILEPYIPRGGRTLLFGPAGSLKSLWAMWLATWVARDGGRSAYFSLEMRPSDTARRLKQLDPPRDRFTCFTKDFRIGSPAHLEKLVRGLRNYDLIVIDSWTAARAGLKDSNEQIAALDTEFFLPLVKHTGAAVVILDNTGHPAFTNTGPIEMDHARGASAKGDKMDVTIQFKRPDKDNNYLAEMHVRKMRLDHPIPKPVRIAAQPPGIEFTIVDGDDRPIKAMWPGLQFVNDSEQTPIEQIAEARLKDRFGAVR